MKQEEANKVSRNHIGACREGVLHVQETVAPATNHSRDAETAEPCLRTVPDNGKHDTHRLAYIGTVHTKYYSTKHLAFHLIGWDRHTFARQRSQCATLHPSIRYQSREEP